MCQNGLKTMIYEGKSTYVQTLNQKINIFKQITDSESENVLKMYIFETLKQHSFIPIQPTSTGWILQPQKQSLYFL